jgi:hypothetical protein
MNDCDYEELKHIAWQKFLEERKAPEKWYATLSHRYDDDFRRGKFWLTRSKAVDKYYYSLYFDCTLISELDNEAELALFYGYLKTKKCELEKKRECERFKKSLFDVEESSKPRWYNYLLSYFKGN